MCGRSKSGTQWDKDVEKGGEMIEGAYLLVTEDHRRRDYLRWQRLQVASKPAAERSERHPEADMGTTSPETTKQP